MKIVSAAEMREIDRATSERFGVPSINLMENAGSAVARFVLSEYPKAERVGIVCGKGNNGGDGFVAARRLVEAGRAVRVVLLCDPEELRGDAAAMFQGMVKSLHSVNIAPLIVREANGLDAPDAAEIFSADVMVDAILGTGFRPPVSPLYAAAIARMNAAPAPGVIIAVDIPSGVDADAMQPTGSGGTARADAVVTFTAPRPAHVFAALVNKAGGPTVIAPIGSPPEAIVSQLGLHLSTPSDFAALLAPREREGNKGSYGHVLVIGGSLGKAGAAAMAGFSALRAGAGLSTVATSKSALAAVAGFHPELMTVPLAETEEGSISSRALGPELDALLEHKTLAIGPGISRNAETAGFVRSIVTRGSSSLAANSTASSLAKFGCRHGGRCRCAECFRRSGGPTARPRSNPGHYSASGRNVAPDGLAYRRNSSQSPGRRAKVFPRA
jgi:ADP-dependent NAD(P)H-hydrate dehydratase / NAD(P)H-hydrate epimerase